MIRHIAAGLGTLAIISGTALAIPAAAQAANGTLTLVPQTFTNPSGCYNSQIFPLIATNNTDQTVTVYDQPDCRGDVIATVSPGESTTQEFGASVSVP